MPAAGAYSNISCPPSGQASWTRYVSKAPAGTVAFDVEVSETAIVISASKVEFRISGGFESNSRNTSSAIEEFSVTAPENPTGTGYRQSSATTRLEVEFVHRRVNGTFRMSTWPDAEIRTSVFTILREASANSSSPVRFHTPVAETFPEGVSKVPSRLPVPPVPTTMTSWAIPRTVRFSRPVMSARRVPFRNTDPSKVELNRYSQ